MSKFNEHLANQTVRVPTALLHLCIQGSAKVVIDDNSWYDIGVSPPGRSNSELKLNLNINHFRMLCLLYSATDTPGESVLKRAYLPKIYRQTNSPSTREKNLCARLIADIGDIYIKRSIVSTGRNGSKIIDEHIFPAIEAFRVRNRWKIDPQGTKHLSMRVWENLYYTTEFLTLVTLASKQSKSMPIHVPSMLSLGSDIAAKIYCTVANSALRRRSDDPMLYAVSSLFEKIGVKSMKYRSQRRKVLTQNTHSVLKSLDGTPILNGRMRVNLRPNATDQDDLLVVWMEPNDNSLIDTPKTKPSVIKQKWLKAGKTESEFHNRIRKSKPLMLHELDTLNSAGVSINKCKPTITLLKALLNPKDWDSLLSGIKNDHLESRVNGRSIINITGLFISRGIERLSD